MAGSSAGAIVFGVCLLLLYLASTLYHAIQHPRRQGRAEGVRPLRDLPADRRHLHALHADRPARRPGAGACSSPSGRWPLAGVVFKLFFTGRFKLLSTAIYIAMGWLVIVAIKPLLAARWTPGPSAGCSPAALFYTLGTVFYHRPSMPYSHAIWHLFVVAGSVCHYVAVMAQVSRPADPAELNCAQRVHRRLTAAAEGEAFMTGVKRARFLPRGCSDRPAPQLTAAHAANVHALAWPTERSQRRDRRSRRSCMAVPASGVDALIVAALALVVLIILWDWNWFKRPGRTRRCKRAPGASSTSRGDLDVDLGWTPSSSGRVGQLRQCHWSKEPMMAAADRAELAHRPVSRCCSMAKSAFREIRLAQTAPAPGNTARTASATGSSANPRPARRIIPRAVDRRRPRALHRRAQARPTSPSACSSDRARRARDAPPIAVDGGGQWRAAQLPLHGTRGRHRLLCAIAGARIASTCAPPPAPPTRMRAAPCSIRCECATSTCSSRCRGRTWPTCIR